MCTATWLEDDDRLALFFNRDELRTRQQAAPPQVRRDREIPYLAPIDGDAGGTWIAANDHGLVLGLLNDYSATSLQPATRLTSRGLLVFELIAARNLAELEARWTTLEPDRYRPFRLLALRPGERVRLFCWNGLEATVDRSVGMPLCSSSFDDAAAAGARTALFQRFRDRADLAPDKRLLRFHQSHQPERGPYSVCMHRPDAVTVSFTLVEVDRERVSMAYAAGPPCSTELGSVVTLERIPL